MRTSQTGSTKVWILVVALAAAVSAILYVGTYWPPGEEGVSGTIVPAERYRSNQISSEDVILGEEESASGEVSDDLASGLLVDSADRGDKSNKADNLNGKSGRNNADNLNGKSGRNNADNLKADNINKADSINKADNSGKADNSNKADRADNSSH